jgi:hypothetical protein
MMIKINIEKAKIIAHDKRRSSRSAEFAPHDEVISKQIPGAASSQAESARQIIREKYAVVQNQIDSAEDISDLSKIVNSLS